MKFVKFLEEACLYYGVKLTFVTQPSTSVSSLLIYCAESQKLQEMKARYLEAQNELATVEELLTYMYAVMCLGKGHHCSQWPINQVDDNRKAGNKMYSNVGQ